MGEVEPGPAGPLEPPEPPEAPASRRPGGIRVLKVRWEGWGGSKEGERPPLPRAVAEAGGDPRAASVRFAAPLPRSLARGAADPAEASATGPRRGLGRLCLPSTAHPWPRATRLAGPRLRSGVRPAAAAHPAPSGPGGPPLPSSASLGAGGRSPVAREQGCKYAGLSPRTPEDITPAGGWRRWLAGRCGVLRAVLGGAGWLCPRGSPPKLGPGWRSEAQAYTLDLPAWRENPPRILISGNLWSRCSGEEGFGRTGIPVLGVGLTIQGDGDGGAVMQQASSRILGQELRGVGGKWKQMQARRRVETWRGWQEV